MPNYVVQKLKNLFQTNIKNNFWLEKTTFKRQTFLYISSIIGLAGLTTGKKWDFRDLFTLAFYYLMKLKISIELRLIIQRITSPPKRRKNIYERKYLCGVSLLDYKPEVKILIKPYPSKDVCHGF